MIVQKYNSNKSMYELQSVFRCSKWTRPDDSSDVTS